MRLEAKESTSYEQMDVHVNLNEPFEIQELRAVVDKNAASERRRPLAQVPLQPDGQISVLQR